MMKTWRAILEVVTANTLLIDSECRHGVFVQKDKIQGELKEGGYMPPSLPKLIEVLEDSCEAIGTALSIAETEVESEEVPSA